MLSCFRACSVDHRTWCWGKYVNSKATFEKDDVEMCTYGMSYKEKRLLKDCRLRSKHCDFLSNSKDLQVVLFFDLGQVRLQLIECKARQPQLLRP